MTPSSWATLLVTFAVAVMSPGPDFLATLRMSLSRGRRHGIATGLGIGIGTSLWAVGTMAGIVAIISTSPTIFLIVRLIGATFLAIYGARILLSTYRSHDSSKSTDEGAAAAPPDTAGENTEDYPRWKAFRLGFLTTTVGNPKAVIFFTTLFAAMLPSTITFGQGALLTVLMVLISSTWFTVVASVASVPAFVRGYEKMHTPIDVILGSLFVILGVALIPWSSLFG
ncbi:MAG: LysE family translocator [Gleimia sp.]|jgi:threonine/homoserine/homoserine lactone efflux protein